MTKYFIILLLCIQLVVADDYYVATDGDDGGAGTIGDPWLTIDYGESQMTTPGDILHIRAGTYYETVSIANEGTGGNINTIQNYESEEVILDGTKPVTGWTQCASDEAGLTVQSVTNANYANIYKLAIHTDDIGTDVDDFMLFEAGVHSQIARKPDAEVGYGVDYSLFTALAAEAWGQTTNLIDSDVLTQADDYWNGAYCDIFLRGANGWVHRHVVADSDQSSTNVTFTAPTSNAIGEGDSYSMVNHPHILDSVGEFYYDPTPSEGYYTFYLWPCSTDNLASGVRIPSKSSGFSAYQKSYITIDGIKVLGYSGVGIDFYRYNEPDETDITISNCVVWDVGADGIYLRYVDNAVIDSCEVWRAGGRGCFINQGANGVIENCDVGDTTSTNISIYYGDHSRINNNKVHGIAGGHGNGISVYNDCFQCLVAFNDCSPGTNIAFNGTEDLIVFGNVVTAYDESQYYLAKWSGSTAKGYHVWAHNTASQGNGNMFVVGALFFSEAYPDTNQDPNTMPTNYVFNNLIDGAPNWNPLQPSGTWEGDTRFIMADRTYNYYTRYSWTQGGSWSLNEGEVDGRGVDLDTIFTDPVKLDTQDYTLVAGSPLIAAGKSLSAYLADPNGPFADWDAFDFTVDIDGVSWEATPSIGAYENKDAPDMPQITSPTVTSITTTTATIGANVTTSGGSALTLNGTVWGTSSTPTGNEVDETSHTVGVFTHGRTGITAGTKIYYRGVAENSEGKVYSEEGSFYTEPTTQPTNIVFSSVGNTGMTISWDVGNGDGAIVIMRADDAVNVDAIDGEEFSPSSVFQSEKIGGDCYVMYRGSGTTVAVTGLYHSTTYHVAIYEYAGTGVDVGDDYGINYQQDAPLIGNQATTTPPTGVYWIGTK